MSEQHDPQPGELWRTEIYYGVEMRDGRWVLPDSGDPVLDQDQTPEVLVGHSVGYVAALRASQAEALAEFRDTIEARNATIADLQRRNNDLAEALERAEEQIAETLDDPYSELNQRAGAWDVVAGHPLIGPRNSLPSADTYADRVRLKLDELAAEPLDDIIEREPWRIVRAAEKLIRGHWNFDGMDSVRLTALADELEEDAAKAGRVAALIERAAQAMASADDGDKVSLRALWDGYLTESTRERYLLRARALHAAGLLADGDQS